MHHIHHTEGFIISGIDTKEADRFLTIFTKDFGLIRASAGGIRKLSSKLRYILHDTAHAYIDIVRGRDAWRVTSASKSPLLDMLSKRPYLIPIMGRLGLLITRLCHGEEENMHLYTILKEGVSFAIALPDTDYSLYDAFEVVMVSKILASLGYGSISILEINTKPFDHALLEQVKQERIHLLREINTTLRETHL